MRIFRSIFLPTIIVILLVSFWFSPDFQVIAAGISIFLFGMYFLENGFNAFTGGLLEKILLKTTNKLWKSIGFGIVTTTVMQSSSLVSVIAISFISAGLIGLTAGIGIVFGANLGTTTGAWLVAAFGLKVKISTYAMPMLVVGLILSFQKSKNLSGIGFILAGLGFLFLGIHYMKEGFAAFKDQIDLAAFAITGIKGLLIYSLIGVAATVIMQSSHATLVLIITALSQQHVTYENAIALAIGANIGTTITAIIGSLSANYQGKRLAMAHLIFNVVTGSIAIIGIQVLVIAVDYCSNLLGIAKDAYTLKLAVFHTIFNLIGVVVMVPFVGRLVYALERWISPPKKGISEPYFLNDTALDFPETLLISVRKEIIHLYNNISYLFVNTLHMTRSVLDEGENLDSVIRNHQKTIEYDYEERYHTKVKPLFAAIIEFISRGQDRIPPKQAPLLFELRLACLSLTESVKAVDGLRKNMAVNLNSDNETIRNEYNQMRIHIVSVLRTLARLEEQTSHDDLLLLELDELRVKIKKYRNETAKRLDHLIRSGAISSISATSILNDRTFTRDTVKGLLNAGKTLFATSNLELKDAEEMVALSDKEISHVIDAEKAIPKNQTPHTNSQ